MDKESMLRNWDENTPNSEICKLNNREGAQIILNYIHERQELCKDEYEDLPVIYGSYNDGKINYDIWREDDGIIQDVWYDRNEGVLLDLGYRPEGIRMSAVEFFCKYHPREFVGIVRLCDINKRDADGNSVNWYKCVDDIR